MSGTAPASREPFSTRAVLALVLLGALLFVALLWSLGVGGASGATNDGGNHAGGKGLNGYAALAGYLEKRGYAVRRSQAEAALDDSGVLVLTPPAQADGAELARIVAARRYIGATLVVTPKWQAVPVPATIPGAQDGWVEIVGVAPPVWRGFLDELEVAIAPLGGQARWSDGIRTGRLPAPQRVLSGKGSRLVPLVVTADGSRVLAGYMADGGFYPSLDGRALVRAPEGDNENLYPVVVVFEPDLLDNYGFADPANARMAEGLFGALSGGVAGRTVIFDLTLNGLGRSANLLTLAFTPPFLAATLCLLIAAIAVGWRAFLRFGPPRAGVPAIPFGKGALVRNAAGLIRRSRRHHLIAAPYAAAVRGRLQRELALPRVADAAQAEAAIDRALAARDPNAVPFSITAARLRAARKPHELLKAARELHQLERMLKR